MTKRDFDAVIVGSGPNGFAAAITLQQLGLSTLLLEAKATVGGGMRSAELTLPGFIHDVCAAIHPMAAGSPFFSRLPLHEFGLTFIEPTIAAAHPFDNGKAAVLHHSIQKTIDGLGIDGSAYEKLVMPFYKNWDKILPFVLGPLTFPAHPFIMAGFGLKALQPAAILAKTFKTEAVRGLFAGMAAHSMLPFSKAATSAIALVLMMAAHHKGWPLVKGGSQQLANALAACYISLGGKIETGVNVTSLQQLPSSHAVLFDVSPGQLLQIAGHRFSALYEKQLMHYKYGMGVYKIDFALSEPIPFTAPECRQAGTVHIGNSIKEIALSEALAWNGKHADKPFVLLAQQSLFDALRAPQGKHTAWAYCHVPNGSAKNMTGIIEQQIERFAPGFRDCILAKHEMNAAAMQAYNANYIGGDINGGAPLLRQLFTRPALRWAPYKTAAKGLYICSASTPPGGGVHGMCGYHAARQAMKDVFKQA
ncbi:phytoene desaturase family protein [Parafilimonas sp.]|uniref:phytoene desaturase family protein n=1 Tax=Parafilimonas sp. TaxID=1969739 RepID=UPI0039E4746D